MQNQQSLKKSNDKRRMKVRKKRMIRLTWYAIFFITFVVFIFRSLNSIIFFNKGFLDVSLSQGLQLGGNESLFELTLEWPSLDVDTFKNIQLKINEQEIELDITETSFETYLDEPDTEYNIEFKANRQGFGFAKKYDMTIKTSGNNEVLNQSINNIDFQDDKLIFEHTLTDLPQDFQAITYELISLWKQQSINLEADLLEETSNYKTFKVTIPISDYLECPTLSLNIRANLNDLTFIAPVTDRNDVITQNFASSGIAFSLHLDHNQFVLINNSLEQYTYSTHHFFSESLHLETQEENNPTTYQFINTVDGTVDEKTYSDFNNLAIDLADLDEGEYFISLNERLIYMNEEINEVWYTITRDGFANKVMMLRKSGFLVIKVEKVSELPETVYDILIDPGHGGPDGGAQWNGLSEAEEVLKISEYMTKRFEDHGLKVKMSRTGDYEPSGDETFDHIRSSYYENGRVSQVYEYQAKYYISNHLNAFNGEIEGFEIYSSIFTTNDWPQLVASSLMNAGHIARDSLNSPGRVSEGSFKNGISCPLLVTYHELFGCTVTELDPLYVIRETGGQLNFAAEMVRYNMLLYPEVPNFGAEAILIEYNYIDHVNDANRWRENWQNWGEAVVKATVDYMGIEYRE